MSMDTQRQMDAIESMMDKGQRSVHMERHTWLIWGLASALLILFLDFVFAEISMAQWLHNIIETAIIVVILVVAGIIDFRLTKKLRRQRGESLSFVQVQVTKIWWFLIGLIIFINLGMNFFGGGYLFYPILIVILGVALQMHGLFSRPMYCWIGHCLIFMGAAALALQTPYFFMRWLALFVLGFGLPFIALIQDKAYFSEANFTRKILLTFAFLLITVIPATVAIQASRYNDTGNIPVVNLQQYQNLSEAQRKSLHYVRFPKEYEFKLDLIFSGPLFEGNVVKARIPFRTSRDTDIAFKNGKAVGYFRLPGDDKRLFLMMRPDRMESHLRIDQDLRMVQKFNVEAKQ